MRDSEPMIARRLPAWTTLRQALHAEPETAFEERATAARIVAALAEVPGLTIRSGVAGTGVVATLGAGKAGPCLALRADMDALPVTEESDRPYASRRAGVAHVCGHDGHVACLVGAAQVLGELADELAGPVRFIFQPAEENGGGGRLMVEQGALDDPPVAAIYALHGWPGLPLGTVGIRGGAMMAATDALDVILHGRGTHAASPHLGIDPIVAAAHVVTALQSVVTRNLPPSEPAVVTIGRIAGGTIRNVIPDSVRLEGTLRTLSEPVREMARAAVRRVIEQTAAAFGARAEVTLTPGYPVLVNDAAATARVVRVATARLGAAAVRSDLPVSLGGEDFAYYLQRVPGALWRLGVSLPGGGAEIPLHSARFDFPDAAIPLGVGLHCALARDFLKHHG